MEKAVNQNNVNGCANSTIVKEFFDQEWDLYKKVVNLNYMAHKELLEHLSKFFSSVLPPMFSVLELGCGDASLLSSALQGDSGRLLLWGRYFTVCPGDCRSEYATASL